MVKCGIISTVYNEEFLLPFFFSHYNEFADKYYIIFDEDSTDGSLDIIKSQTKVTNIIPIKYPNKFDTDIKTKMINDIYSGIHDCDWVLNVDADEFIFPIPLNTDFKSILIKEQKKRVDIIKTYMWQVYRNVRDSDLDPEKRPVVTQRRYGDPSFDGKNAQYIKPIIARSGLDIKWGRGNHKIAPSTYKYKISKYKMAGAHWANADPCFCVERRTKNRRDRFSENNLQRGWGIQNHGIIEQDVMNLCLEHSRDPILF